MVNPEPVRAERPRTTSLLAYEGGTDIREPQASGHAADPPQRARRLAWSKPHGDSRGGDRGHMGMLKQHRIVRCAVTSVIAAAILGAATPQAVAQPCDDRYPLGCMGPSRPTWPTPQPARGRSALPRLVSPPPNAPLPKCRCKPTVGPRVIGICTKGFSCRFNSKASIGCCRRRVQSRTPMSVWPSFRSRRTGGGHVWPL